MKKFTSTFKMQVIVFLLSFTCFLVFREVSAEDNKTTIQMPARSGTLEMALGKVLFLPCAISDSVRPVKLSSCPVQAEDNTKLAWEIPSETIIEGFDVGQTSNVKSWLNIGSVISESQSKLLKHNNHTQTNPETGENLYWLKMIDKGGAFSARRLRSLMFNNGSNAFMSPNPVADWIYFNKSEISQIRNVTIYNIYGKEVKKKGTFAESSLYMKHLPAGISAKPMAVNVLLR